MSDPDRKDSPASIREGELDPKCVNSGNPVFTCRPPPPDSPPQAPTEELSQKPNPFYQTTSSRYGISGPSDEMLPLTYHGKSNKFSEHLMNAGMYRNNSLNTATDKNPF